MNFRVQSRTLQRSLFWKNVKIYVLFALIGLVSENLFINKNKTLLNFKIVFKL